MTSSGKHCFFLSLKFYYRLSNTYVINIVLTSVSYLLTHLLTYLLTYLLIEASCKYMLNEHAVYFCQMSCTNKLSFEWFHVSSNFRCKRCCIFCGIHLATRGKQEWLVRLRRCWNSCSWRPVANWQRSLFPTRRPQQKWVAQSINLRPPDGWYRGSICFRDKQLLLLSFYFVNIVT